MGKYFKWSEISDNFLIQNHNKGYRYIAAELGCSYTAAKARGSLLIKAEKLSRIEYPPKFISTPAPKTSVQELLQYVVNYKSKESCPFPYQTRIIGHFGSWGAALKAAGLKPNVGGKMDPDKLTTLYLIKFDGFYKFGITQRTISLRFGGAPKYTVVDQLVTTLEEALDLESAIKQNVVQFIPTDPWFERNGKTECFRAENSAKSMQSQELKLEDLV